jgi:hypothetical protein
MEVIMKIWYLLLVGLSLIVACGKPPEPPPPPPVPPTVTLTASELNPALNSSVIFTATATPADNIAKLELLEGTTILKTEEGTATLEQSVLMDVVGLKSFTARVTDTAGVSVSSAVIAVNTETASSATLKAEPSVVTVGGSSKLVPQLVSGNSGIAEVEFFEGIDSLGKVTSAPFELVVNNFTAAGIREFKVVITDTNGLKIEALKSVKAFDFVLKILSNVFNGRLLSPDSTIFEVIYTGDLLGLNQATNWSILKSDRSPAPTDGSFGKLQAILGEIGGLQATRVRYVPPTMSNDAESLTVIIKATSVVDAFQSDSTLFTIRKKGTVTGMSLILVPTNQQPLSITTNVGDVTEFRVKTTGDGNSSGVATFFLSGVSGIGTLECSLGAVCQLTATSITTDRIKFTATRVGSGTISATSFDNPNLNTTINTKVNP